MHIQLDWVQVTRVQDEVVDNQLERSSHRCHPCECVHYRREEEEWKRGKKRQKRRREGREVEIDWWGMFWIFLCLLLSVLFSLFCCCSTAERTSCRRSTASFSCALTTAARTSSLYTMWCAPPLCFFAILPSVWCTSTMCCAVERATPVVSVIFFHDAPCSRRQTTVNSSLCSICLRLRGEGRCCSSDDMMCEREGKRSEKINSYFSTPRHPRQGPNWMWKPVYLDEEY